MNENFLSDAHIHLSDFALRFLPEHAVLSVISTQTPAEYASACRLAETLPHVHVSLGIHPWQLPQDEGTAKAMLSLMEGAHIIGEIGLDNVWCDSDQEAQLLWFERQLDFACARKIPVVLHLKGREKEALQILRRYDNIYHLHWYSCNDYLDDYLALGCYLSVGPFPSLDPAVAAVAVRTPLERLLIETDGIEAVRWALGKPAAAIDYAAALRQIASEIAALRGLDTAFVLAQTHRNLQRFLSLDYK